MIPIYALAWLGLMVIGFVNGIIREISYKRWVGELAGPWLQTARPWR